MHQSATYVVYLHYSSKQKSKRLLTNASITLQIAWFFILISKQHDHHLHANILLLTHTVEIYLLVASNSRVTAGRIQHRNQKHSETIENIMSKKRKTEQILKKKYDSIQKVCAD